MMEEPLSTGFTAYKKSTNKHIFNAEIYRSHFAHLAKEHKITDIVCIFRCFMILRLFGYIDKIADLFLEQMITLMMQSQSVPEILGVAKKNSAHEDFNPNVAENRDKIDFDRKWNHTRTKLGAPLSLDELAASNPSALEDGRSIFETGDEEYETLEKQFLDTLNGTDREIYLMRKQGCTQAEIAERLGYKSHSAVTKRMEKMKKMLIDFCADFNS